MTHTVVGLFEERNSAEAAMAELTAQGFVKENIDLSNRRFADTTANTTASTNVDRADAAAGTTGVAGESFGDKVSNFFSSLFGDDETTARNYANAASDAEAILTVQVDSDERARKAQEILDRNGAFDVDERGAQHEGQLSGHTASATGARATAENRDAATAERTIPVVEEKLDVGKREVESGGARIRSRIVEKPVEEKIRLREEHVVVNRRPVDRDVTDADRRNFQPGEMTITERSEVPVVGKQSRVVEEIEVGKNVTEREETIRDTVRSTDVNVEELDDHTKRTTDTKARPAKP